MSEIKVIDLLNKIANGEEVPKKIKYKNDILKYDEEVQDYMGCSKIGSGSFFNYLFVNHATSDFINDTVEIIEEPEINIHEIKTLEYDVKDEKGVGYYRLDTIAEKTKELIQAVKQLDKRIGEINE